MSKYEMHLSFTGQHKQFTNGIRRTVADKNKVEGNSMLIGKKKMDFNIYQLMCELFMREEGEEFIFSRCFLTLEWNLMARSENVVHAHMFHITWENDSLVFRFVKSKGDQTGKKRDQAWHVYANPNNSAVCPVLAIAMACYIFTNPGIFGASAEEGHNASMMTTLLEVPEEPGMEEHGGQLFPGAYQYVWFMDCIHRIIAKYPREFFAVGISASDLGLHSARKGAASHACAGSTVSPPMVSVCLRAMWSMGHVKERYLQYEKAGDQYLGRVVCGLDVNNVSFAVSPPFFDAESKTLEKIHTLLKDYAVRGDLVTPHMRRVFYFCFASLSYHRDFVAANLHQRSKLQASPFFNATPNYAKDAAVVKYPWTSTETTPTFTGLPPHVVILATCEELKFELAKAKGEIIQDIKDDLDSRRIGSQSHYDKEEIICKMGALHDALLEKIARVGSGYASYASQSDDYCENADVVLQRVSDSNDVTCTTNTITMVEPDGGRRFQFFYRKGGTVSRLPEGFVLPRMTFATLLTSWFCGNQSKKTIPFKLLRATELENKCEKFQLCIMRTLIEAVIAGAKQGGVWNEQRGAWDVGSTVRLYENVVHLFKYPTKNEKIRRNTQISWLTIYNLYVAHGRNFATELAEE